MGKICVFFEVFLGIEYEGPNEKGYNVKGPKKGRKIKNAEKRDEILKKRLKIAEKSPRGNPLGLIPKTLEQIFQNLQKNHDFFRWNLVFAIHFIEYYYLTPRKTLRE